MTAEAKCQQFASISGFSREKKYQALSACINSFSRSGAEEPENEASAYVVNLRFPVECHYVLRSRRAPPSILTL